MELRVRLRSWWEEVTSSLWFRPTLITIMSIVLAFASGTIDQRVDPPDWLITGPDNARAMLSAIASSTLTVTSLTFSIIMMALVLGSQQFSPRTLRNFMRDGGSQNVLGIFIGTFIYSLLILAQVADSGDSNFVPVFSVFMSLLFALLSVGSLIYFINHISKAMQVNHLIAEINQQTEEALDDPLPGRFLTSFADVAVEEPPDLDEADAAQVRAEEAGYLQAVDPDGLVHLAVDFDVAICLARRVGEFVPKQSTIFHVWPAARLSDDLHQRLLHAISVGETRTMFEDALYGFRQLVDIALKALSPGVNDPTTATNCVDYLGNLLIQMASRDDPVPWRYDENEQLRVIIYGVTFEDAVNLAFNEIRQYSSSDLATTLHMLDTLCEIADVTIDPERLSLLWRHARMIVRNAGEAVSEPHDREVINQRLCRVGDAVGRPCVSGMLSVQRAESGEQRAESRGRR